MINEILIIFKDIKRNIVCFNKERKEIVCRNMKIPTFEVYDWKRSYGKMV